MPKSALIPIAEVNTFEISIDVPHDESLRSLENSAVFKTQAALSRRIKASDLSPEDKIILEMKNERCSNATIADHLRREGYINYVPKSIGSRWVRLRNRLAIYRDAELDKGNYHWDKKEDIQLINSVIRAKATVSQIISEAEAKLWDLVAKELHEADRTLIFSQNACRERYDKIREGFVHWYGDLGNSETQRKFDHAKQNFSHTRNILHQAETEADLELKAALHNSQKDHQDPPVSESKTTIKEASDSVPIVKTNEDTVHHDPTITVLPGWITKTASKVKAIEESHKALKEVNWLPSVASMDRKQLMAELGARGFQAQAGVVQLREFLHRARQGHTDIPRLNGDLISIEALKEIMLGRGSGNGRGPKVTTANLNVAGENAHTETLQQVGRKRKTAGSGRGEGRAIKRVKQGVTADAVATHGDD